MIKAAKSDGILGALPQECQAFQDMLVSVGLIETIERTIWAESSSQPTIHRVGKEPFRQVVGAEVHRGRLEATRCRAMERHGCSE